jgi:hypothetical protein
MKSWFCLQENIKNEVSVIVKDYRMNQSDVINVKNNKIMPMDQIMTATAIGFLVFKNRT